MNSSKGEFVLEATRVFDGDTVHAGWDIVVRDGRVDAVGPGAGYAVDNRIAYGDATLLPGLIDAHTHTDIAGLRAAVRFGVTTEIDLGSDPQWMTPARRAARDTTDVAAVISASFGATISGGHPNVLVGTHYPRPFPTVERPEDAGSFVHDRIAEGADLVKLIIEDYACWPYAPVPRMSSDLATALVGAAHAAGMRAVAHVTSVSGLAQAVDAGVDGIAHLPMDRTPDLGELIRRMAAVGVFCTTTLTMLAALSGEHDAAALADDPRVAMRLDTDELATLRRRHRTKYHPAPALIAMHSTVRDLAENGVTLLAGTDAASAAIPGLAHGASLHEEMRLLVRAGLTPTEALRSATSSVADAYGLESGRVRPGAPADFLVVSGDPTVDIRDSLNIRGVWRRGTSVGPGSDRRI